MSNTHCSYYHLLQIPARIEKLIEDGQLYAAVQLHVQSALLLEREGLQVVGSADNLLILWLHSTTGFALDLKKKKLR